MKTTLILMTIAMAASFGPASVAQDSKPAQPAAAKPAVAVLSQEKLEAQFKTWLTKASMNGRWASTDNAKLGPEKEDKYTIISANKVEGDNWVISARMQYGKMDMVLPVPVQVKWAGDTAVITVNDLALGGGKSYSARVMVFNQTYAGSWTSSAGYGGLMYGTIVNDPPGATRPVEPKAAEPKSTGPN